MKPKLIRSFFVRMDDVSKQFISNDKMTETKRNKAIHEMSLIEKKIAKEIHRSVRPFFKAMNTIFCLPHYKDVRLVERLRKSLGKFI
jgi:hypothetical protein